MKRLLAVLICTALFLAGCSTTSEAKNGETGSNFNSSEENYDEPAASGREVAFDSLGDPNLLQYVEDSVFASVAEGLSSDDYVIENVVATYVSKEYLEEVKYNSQENLYFGYELSGIEAQFEGAKYVFAVDEAGKTVVRAFEGYDDTYDQVLKNVAIGAGVILICVTVSVVAGTVGVPAAGAVSTVFMTSALTGTKVALASGAIGGLASGIVSGLETRDSEAALKAVALGASEGIKWGAITGVIAGGAAKALAIQKSSTSTIPSHRQSEIDALKKYGGEEQQSFLGGIKVSNGTVGSTRPDIIRVHKGKLEAIEVKNYDLTASLKPMAVELKRQVTQRIGDLPPGATQRVVIDVRGRGYSSKFLKEVHKYLEAELASVYPKIPIKFLR